MEKADQNEQFKQNLQVKSILYKQNMQEKQEKTLKADKVPQNWEDLITSPMYIKLVPLSNEYGLLKESQYKTSTYSDIKEAKKKDFYQILISPNQPADAMNFMSIEDYLLKYSSKYSSMERHQQRIVFDALKSTLDYMLGLMKEPNEWIFKT